MLRRRPLTVVAAAALLLSAGGTAFADDTLPGSDTALVEVYVPSEADVDKLAESYDLAEYKRVEDDGRSCSTSTPTRPSGRRCVPRGYRIGRTIEDASTRAAVNEERETTAAQEELARDLAENGVPAGRREARGQAARPAAGRDRDPARQHVHQLRRPLPLRRGAQQGDRRASARRNTAIVTGPALALSFAGADGVFGTAVNMDVFTDCDTTPDVYMYHRHLLRLAPAREPDDQMTVRVASASGARRHLPGHGVAGHVAAAERRGLPEGLLQPLPGPDREPRPARRAGRAVPEPGDAGQPAEPDQRLPAQGADDDRRAGRRPALLRPGRDPHRPGRGLGNKRHVHRLGP